MNQLPKNSLRIYDVISVTSDLIGLNLPLLDLFIIYMFCDLRDCFDVQPWTTCIPGNILYQLEPTLLSLLNFLCPNDVLQAVKFPQIYVLHNQCVDLTMCLISLLKVIVLILNLLNKIWIY